MNNNQNYRIEGDWVIDSHGNKASISHWWSEALAIESLKTLVNCKNCINCYRCRDCKNCMNCKTCRDCYTRDNCYMGNSLDYVKHYNNNNNHAD